MDDLITWLRAQLDDDERVAHECLQAPADRLGVQLGTYRWEAREDGVWCRNYLVAPRVSDEDGAHIARWDPARVLAEVEAKRRIIERYEDCLARQEDPDYSSIAAHGQAAEYEDWVIPALAQPYAGRPGWREEWAA